MRTRVKNFNEFVIIEKFENYFEIFRFECFKFKYNRFVKFFNKFKYIK